MERRGSDTKYPRRMHGIASQGLQQRQRTEQARPACSVEKRPQMHEGAHHGSRPVPINPPTGPLTADTAAAHARSPQAWDAARVSREPRPTPVPGVRGRARAVPATHRTRERIGRLDGHIARVPDVHEHRMAAASSSLYAWRQPVWHRALGFHGAVSPLPGAAVRPRARPLIEPRAGLTPPLHRGQRQE